MERFLYNRPEHKTVLSINDNTQVIASSGIDFETIRSRAPRKVATRISINLSGLNRLATTIVMPDKVRELEMKDLLAILQFSNQANQKLNLPQTDNLILRSAFIAPQKPSEPALLIKNIHGPNTNYEYLDEGTKRKIGNHMEFTHNLRNNTHLLIHDDNYELQTGGIHVRTHESLKGGELLFGTNALQTRDLEMEQKRKPSIRINTFSPTVASHYKMAELFAFNKKDIEYMFNNNLENFTSDGKSIRLRNIDRHKAFELLQNIKKDEASLLKVHEAGQDMKGPEAVVESRIYLTLPGGIGRRIQVLDID